MDKLKTVVIAKDNIAFEGEVEAIIVPTQTGIIEVLPEHMQLVSALTKGELIVKTPEGQENKHFKVTGGVLEVRAHSNVIILVDIEKE